MTPTDTTRDYVIQAYVTPARQRGDQIVQVRVGNVLKELGWTNRTPSVFSTLSSQSFLRTAGLELIEKKGGPSSGGPSTTVVFQYRVLAAGLQAVSDSPSAEKPRGGLLAAYGICREMYRDAGGSEAFIRSQREDFGSIVSDSPKIAEGRS